MNKIVQLANATIEQAHPTDEKELSVVKICTAGISSINKREYSNFVDLAGSLKKLVGRRILGVRAHNEYHPKDNPDQCIVSLVITLE